MDSKEADQHIEALLNMVHVEQRSPQECTLQSMAVLGIKPGETLEVRISSEQFCDPADLAQRAANLMFAQLAVYPTSIAVHTTIAALLITNEVVIVARTENEMLRRAQEAAFGKAFLETPIRIDIDNSLDTKTAVARFKVDLKSEEYGKAVEAMLLRYIEEGRL